MNDRLCNGGTTGLIDEMWWKEGATDFHDDQVNDEHFAFVIELGNVNPAEVVGPASIVKRGNAAVVRPDVKTRPARILQRPSTLIFIFYATSS